MLKGFAKIQLPGKTTPVAQPDGQGPGAEFHAIFNDFDIVPDSLPAHLLIHVLHGAILVTQLLSPLVLESIGVHGVEPQTIMRRQRPDPCAVLWDIPGYVQGNGAAGAVECMDETYVFHFFLQVPRLAADAEAAKTRSAGTQRPAGDGNLEGH